MENLVTMQDTTLEKIPNVEEMPKYVDLVEVVTEEDADFIALAPRYSHINEGDVVEVDNVKATVIQTMDWVDTTGDAYKFISKMFPNMVKINHVWKRKELRWNE